MKYKYPNIYSRKKPMIILLFDLSIRFGACKEGLYILTIQVWKVHELKRVEIFWGTLFAAALVGLRTVTHSSAYFLLNKWIDIQ